jgi:hypothetical protein
MGGFTVDAVDLTGAASPLIRVMIVTPDMLGTPSRVLDEAGAGDDTDDSPA